MTTFFVILGLVWLAVAGWFYWRESDRYRDMAAAAILAVLTLGFFWRVVAGDVYQPADGGDLVSFLFPTYRFAAAQLSQWALPLWNPHLYGGAPFISDIQAGFLYPPNLLFFLLKPDFGYRALQWLVLGHVYWAGLGVYVLVRTFHWGGRPISRPAALFGALAFQFSDPLFIHLGNLNLIAVLSWLPWVLAACHLALERQSLRWAGIAGLLFALGNYAGHAQSSVYTGLGVGLYTVLWAKTRAGQAGIRDWGLGMGKGRWFRSSPRITRVNGEQPGKLHGFFVIYQSLLTLLVLFGVTFLLSAPILLPALQLSQFTERSQFSYQDTVGFSLAPTQVIGLLTPGFFGRGPALHWSLWDRVELPYAGVATLLLAALAFGVAIRDPRRRPFLVRWLGLALFGFVTALGVYAIIHGWLTVLIPGFGQFRAPARALVLWTLGIAILGAAGLDSLRHREAWGMGPADSDGPDGGLLEVRTSLRTWLRFGTAVLFGLCLPLLYLALLITQPDPTLFLRTSVSALAVVLMAGFWLGTWTLVEARWRGWLSYPAFAVLAVGLLFFDLSATGAYTDVSESDPSRGFHHPEIVAFLRDDPDLFRIDTRTDIAGLWQPDAAAFHGLQDVGGVANPLLLRHWDRLWESTGGRHTRLYDMFNVKYVLVRDGTPLAEEKFDLVFDAPDELSVYRNRDFVPRAWLVQDSVWQPDMAAALAFLQQEGFDPQQTVVLVGEQASDASSAAVGDDAQEAVTMTHYGSGELAIQVRTDVPGTLVLSEVWYPGWKATVNGARAEILLANGALRAVAVPAGESAVRLWFAPVSWYWGLAALVLGLIVVAGLIGAVSKPPAKGSGMA